MAEGVSFGPAGLRVRGWYVLPSSVAHTKRRWPAIALSRPPSTDCKKGTHMTRKKTRQTRPGAQGVPKKHRSRGGKPSGNAPSQTNQPNEQDTKRRVGQFSGAGEPPLMKK
jgi:hypothetical protein